MNIKHLEKSKCFFRAQKGGSACSFGNGYQSLLGGWYSFGYSF